MVCYKQAERLLGRDAGDLNLIIAHLGAGASMAAIRAGRSVDTSMGLTPLEGCARHRVSASYLVTCSHFAHEKACLQSNSVDV